MIALAVALVGGLGAVLRFAVDRVSGLVGARAGSPWPIATVNVAGAVLIGVVAGLALHGQLTSATSTVLATGLCGGFTTFSTASVDSLRLLNARRTVLGLVHLVATAAICVLAAWAGIGLAR